MLAIERGRGTQQIRGSIFLDSRGAEARTLHKGPLSNRQQELSKGEELFWAQVLHMLLMG